MSLPIDRRTVDQLVVEHLPVALRIARRLSGNAEVAEDIVQEALCRILQQWRSYRGEAAISTWMMQIVVNVSRDRHRLKTTESSPDEFVSRAPEPHQEVVADELSQLIREAIDHLPERQREVALLSFGEGFDASDIAYLLDITVANVHTCLHLARRRVAKAIGIEYMPQ
ncbi:MAG: RNA polymerase sigma factor [Aeoliella sp.]